MKPTTPKHKGFDDQAPDATVYTIRNAIDKTPALRVDPSQLKPINDHNHEHQFVRDPSDETESYYAVVCTVPRCNLGQLISKRE